LVGHIIEAKDISTSDISDIVLSHKRMVYFSANAGLSGEAMKTGKEFWTQNKKTDRNEFVNNVDNFLEVKDIKDYLIARLTDGDGNPRGVVQLLNFKNGLKPNDVNRLKVVQSFLGTQIQNVTDFTRSITTMIGLKMETTEAASHFEGAEKAID